MSIQINLFYLKKFNFDSKKKKLHKYQNILETLSIESNNRVVTRVSSTKEIFFKLTDKKIAHNFNSASRKTKSSKKKGVNKYKNK